MNFPSPSIIPVRVWRCSACVPFHWIPIAGSLHNTRVSTLSTTIRQSHHQKSRQALQNCARTNWIDRMPPTVGDYRRQAGALIRMPETIRLMSATQPAKLVTFVHVDVKKREEVQRPSHITRMDPTANPGLLARLTQRMTERTCVISMYISGPENC